MNQTDRNWLVQHFDTDVLFDEPMWRHTTFRIGGPADALVTGSTDKQISKAVQWAQDRGHPIMILGAGSNLLVKDLGVRGLVLKMAGDFETILLVSETHGSSATIKAGAAVSIRRLSKYALEHGLAGMNFALGIPGTVGGALRMNAGAWGACMADRTTLIRVLMPGGDVIPIDRDRLRFSYRSLELEKGAVILGGHFKLDRADPASLEEEAKRIQEKRRLSQPFSLPSAGSFFRNPPGETTAGEFIEKAGLKGHRVGDAEVSTKHANFIVNKGQARASDVLSLMRRIQATVFERFGVQLEPEVTIVGQETGS